MSVKHSHEVPSELLPVGKDAFKAVLISSNEAPNFALRKFSIKSGGSMPFHYNLVEHEQYVLSGSAKVLIDQDEFIVKAGDVVYIPATVPHSYETIGDEAFEFLCIVPNREDETVIVEKDE